MGISFFHKRTFVFNTKFALRLFSIQSFSINLYSAKDILNTMIDDVPCFEENQTLSASLVKSTPHSDPSHSCSESAGPFPSPGPENSSTHQMRATREKSHSQLGGPPSGRLWRNLRVWDPKSAHPTWQNLPGRKTFFAREHHLNVMEKYLWMYPAEETASPKGWPALRYAFWILIQHHQKPAHCSPASCERKDLHMWNMGQPWKWWVFCSFLSQDFPSPHLLCSSRVSPTSSHDTGKAALAHHAPCLFGARMQGKQEGVSLSGA